MGSYSNVHNLITILSLINTSSRNSEEYASEILEEVFFGHYIEVLVTGLTL